MFRRIMLVAACLGILVGASDGAGPPLAKKLPAGAIGYVGWAGRSLTFDGSMFGQLLQEPTLAELLGTVKTAVLRQVRPQKDREALSHLWEMASIAWQHPLAVALLDLKSDDDPDPVEAVMLIELGRDRDSFAQHLEALVQPLEQREVLAQKTAGAVTYRAMPVGDIGELGFGFMDDVFFVCLGDDMPARMASIAPAESLHADKKFAKALKDVTGENVQLAYYLDVAALADRLEAALAPANDPEAKELSRVRAVLGLDRLTTIAGSVRIVERGLYSRTRLFTPAPHRGLLTPFAGAPLTNADLAPAPDDTDCLAAMNIQTDVVYGELRRMIRELSPLADAQLARGLERFEGRSGVSLADDVIAALGDSWFVCSAPSQGGMLTGTVLTVSARDAEKLSAAVAKIEAALCPPAATRPARRRGMSLETVKVGRDEVHYVRFGGRMPIPFAPAWCVQGDKLRVAAWPQVVQSTMQDVKHRKLIQEAAFRRSRSHIKAKPSILLYHNLPKLIRENYHFVLIGWTGAANALSREFGMPVKPDWLPALSTIEKYLWPEVTGISSDAEGITVESYGSMPLTVAQLVPVGAAAAMPALVQARAKAKRTASRAASMANLNAIGKATVLHMGLNDDEVPEGFEPMVEGGMISPDTLVRPGSGRMPPRYQDGEIIGEIDYIYLRLPADAPAQCIRVYERPENYRGKGTLVLRASGAVMWLDQASFERDLKATKDYLKQQADKAPATQPSAE